MNVIGPTSDDRYERFTAEFNHGIEIIVRSDNMFRRHLVLNTHDESERQAAYWMEFDTPGLFKILDFVSSGNNEKFSLWWSNKLKLLWGEELNPLELSKKEIFFCNHCDSRQEIIFVRDANNSWRWKIHPDSQEKFNLHKN